MLRVLIFDSGVGALSISSSLTNIMPELEQILLADNAFFPYGEMQEDALISRVTQLLVHSVSSFQPDCIVVACNTVSTVALDTIRDSLSIPVIGVVPAIKPAAELSSSKVIGLLATPGTINRSYTADLASEHAKDCQLISVGSTRLVEMAEQRLCGQEIDSSEMLEILEPFLAAHKQQNLDALILGCTHFPLLSDVISQQLPSSINLVDSSDAIARQVLNVINGLESTNKNTAVQSKGNTDHLVKKASNDCFLTKYNSNKQLELGLLKYGFRKPQLFSI